jgi:hypothetical protein
MAEPTPPPATQQGQVLKRIAGYELIEKVGQGGMGAVFKARQISLDRVVALKVLPPSIAKNKEFIERFMREARAAGRLNHPNIVQGIDVGLCEKTNLYFFAMEFVDGPTLGRRLKESGALPEEFVRKVAVQIGEALDYANQSGIVHRDIKPDNILMNTQGQAKLADLGLAKQLEKQEDASLTQAGIAVGTPFYMAPEQVRGQLDQIDTRTDLYCLGATLFHMVTGQPPYQGATNAVIMAAHLSDKIPLAHQVNPAVSEGFSRLLYALMQKERTRRPIDPKVFLEMLERVDEVGGTTKRALRGVRNTTGPRDVVRATTGPRDRIRPTTGPRERVDGGPVAGEEVSAKSNTKLYFVVGLVVVMLIGGGVLALLLGKKEIPKEVANRQDPPPAIKPPEADPVPVKAQETPKPAWNAAGEFENAQRAVERNPDDLRGASILWERLLTEARKEKADEVWIKRISDARDEAQTKYIERVAKLRAELDQKVKEARLQGQYDQALQAIATMPSPDEITERERLKELAAGLRKEAEEKLAPLIQKAQTALTAGRLVEAAASLKEAEAVQYQSLAAQIVAVRDQLTEAQAEKERIAAEEAKKAADQGWSKLLAEFDVNALEKGDLEMLRVVLKNARADKVLEPRKEDVALLHEMGTKLIAFTERERKFMASLAGQNVEWTIDGKKVAGRIKSAKDDTIDLTVTLDRVEMVRKIKLSDLSDEDRAKLCPPLSPQGAAESLAAALMKLRKEAEDRDAAAKYLEGAGDSILAQHYRESLGAQQKQGGEDEAEAAWAEIAKKAAEPRLSAKQTEELLDALNGFSGTHGQSKCAADHKQDIVALTERLAPKETDWVKVDRVVFWNLAYTYSDSSVYSYAYRGTVKADIILFLKDKVVGHVPDIKINHKSMVSVSTEVPLRNTVAFDRMQVQVTNWTGAGGGFVEIQVFRGDENLALGRATKASDSDAEGNFSRATDGEITKGTYCKGWMLPSKGKGWIELDFSKPSPKAAKPAPGNGDKPVGVPAGIDGGAQGGWQAPMGGTLRTEDGGRISLAGPGTGDGESAIALFDRAVGARFEVQGQFQRKGPYAGLIVGYDQATQRFISFYSRQDDGVDLYVHNGKKRELLKHVADVSIPEGEWIHFRIEQRGPNVTVEFGEKSHSFKLPEDWPRGRQVGLITHFNSTARAGDVGVTGARDGPPPPEQGRP